MPVSDLDDLSFLAGTVGGDDDEREHLLTFHAEGMP